jgi:hypothetical protein
MRQLNDQPSFKQTNAILLGTNKEMVRKGTGSILGI